MDFVDSIHLFDDIALSQIKHIKIENMQARTRCEQAVYSELSLTHNIIMISKTKAKIRIVKKSAGKKILIIVIAD